MRVMKNCFAACMILALLLSLGTTIAAAEGLPDGVQWQPSAYLCGDPAAFTEAGTITVTWRPGFSKEVDLRDGDLADWYRTGLTPSIIDTHHMIAWVGGPEDVTGGWGITTFAAADATYLYLAFDIMDGDFAYGEEDAYNGDAIQLALDLGGRLNHLLQTDPDSLMSPKNLFYSFSCVEDGAPIRIMRQESEQDSWLTEAYGDGVMGAARKTERGWSVELAFTWQQLYDDYCFKAWEDSNIYLGMAEIDLQLSASLYYLNRTETGGDVTWAAGAVKHRINEEGKPCVSWTPYDNALAWVLPIEREMYFDCGGLVVSWGLETIPEPEETAPPEPEETAPPEPEPEIGTEIGIETDTSPVCVYPLPPVEIESWVEILSDTVEEPPYVEPDDIEAILAKYGCTSTVGFGTLAVLTALAAAAYVLKKK